MSLRGFGGMSRKEGEWRIPGTEWDKRHGLWELLAGALSGGRALEGVPDAGWRVDLGRWPGQERGLYLEANRKSLKGPRQGWLDAMFGTDHSV